MLGDNTGNVPHLVTSTGKNCMMATKKIACVVRVSWADGVKDTLTLPEGYRGYIAMAAGWPKS